MKAGVIGVCLHVFKKQSTVIRFKTIFKLEIGLKIMIVVVNFTTQVSWKGLHPPPLIKFT